MAGSRFKYRDAIGRNLLATGWIFGGWIAGVVLVATGTSWTARLLGCGLVAHTLMMSGWMLHECIHDTIFVRVADNARLGAALAWLNGGCYAGWDALRKKHLHHHTDRMDPVTFDFRAMLASRPALRRLVLALEWAHFPAVELLFRLDAMSRPFRDPAWAPQRARMLATVAVRLLAWGAFAAWAPLGAALYFAAWIVSVVGLRFFDAFHHTFDLVVLPDYEQPFVLPAEWDRAYEQRNTYSNVLSTRWPALDLLVLNFCYHNAHHAKPGIPWHRLPALDRKLFGTTPPQTRPVWGLWSDFHRYRLERVVASTMPERPDVNIGAVAVSFLTL